MFLGCDSLKTGFEPENHMWKVDWWGGEKGWLLGASVWYSHRGVCTEQRANLTLKVAAAEALAQPGAGGGWGVGGGWSGSSELSQIKRGEPDVCILKSANHSPWDTLWEGRYNLGPSSFLQPRAILCEECSCERPGAAPTSEEESISWEQRIRAEHLCSHYIWHKKSVNYKAGDWGFGPGFAKTVCPLGKSLYLCGACMPWL